MRMCKVRDCEKKHKGYGYCDKHYQRFKKRGTIHGFARREYHGLKDLPEYEVWMGIKKRCNNTSATGYKNYGGRGIKICDKWNISFTDFLDDVGRKPSYEHSIDRINNDGNYEPGNVRWATRQQQALNKRQNDKQFKGVNWVPRINKWVAKIHCRPHLIHIGVFHRQVDAALAYDCAAIQLFGEDAVINFPKELK